MRLKHSGDLLESLMVVLKKHVILHSAEFNEIQLEFN